PFTPRTFFQRVECFDEVLGEELVTPIILKDLADIFQEHDTDGVIIPIRSRQRRDRLLHPRGPLATGNFRNRTEWTPVIGCAVVERLRDGRVRRLELRQMILCPAQAAPLQSLSDIAYAVQAQTLHLLMLRLASQAEVKG